MSTTYYAVCDACERKVPLAIRAAGWTSFKMGEHPEEAMARAAAFIQRHVDDLNHGPARIVSDLHPESKWPDDEPPTR